MQSIILQITCMLYYNLLFFPIMDKFIFVTHGMIVAASLASESRLTLVNFIKL